MSLESQLHRRADREFDQQLSNVRGPFQGALWRLIGERSRVLLNEFLAQPEIEAGIAAARLAHREEYISAFLKKWDEASAAPGDGA